MRNFTFHPSFAPAAPISHNQRVDEAYVEYCARKQAGEPLDADEFCRNHPTIQASLLRLILVGQLVEQDTELFRRVAGGWPELGSVYLDEFVLHHQIGEGAFSRVYLATQISMGDRWVVLKVSPHGRSEAQTLGRVAHPNIVEIYSVLPDGENGLSAICMPLQGYATLLEVLDQVRSTPTPPRSAEFLYELARKSPAGLPAVPDWRFPRHAGKDESFVSAMRQQTIQILDALANVHEQGIVHSDLKPSNILLTPTASPLLLDFNLAADDHQDFIRQGGTLFYMSPEQIQHSLQPPKDAKLSPQSDLYSLGVILFELLTGKHPFGPLPTNLGFNELRELLQKRQQTISPSVVRTNPDVDRQFAEFIEQCLAPDLTRRPGSARVARERLLPSEKRLPKLEKANSALLCGSASVAEAEQSSIPRGNTSLWALTGNCLALVAMFAVLSAYLPTRLTDFQKGTTASQNSQWDKAVGHFARAMSSHVETAAVRQEYQKALLYWGVQCYQEKRWTEALEHLNRAQEMGADRVAVLRARGKTLLRIAEQEDGMDPKRFVEASAVLEELHSRCDDPESKVLYGYALQCRGSHARARHVYEEAIKTGNRQSAVQNNLGFAYFRTNAANQAITALSNAIAENPNHPICLHNRARIYLRLATSTNDARVRAEMLALAAEDCRVALRTSKTGGLLGHYSVILAWQNEKDPAVGWDQVRPVLVDAAAHGFDPVSVISNHRFPRSMCLSAEAELEFEMLMGLEISNPQLCDTNPLMSPIDN